MNIGTNISLDKYTMEEILTYFQKETSRFDIFIETGTYCGMSLWEMKDLFKQCISIELSKEYYEYNMEKFKDQKNVRLYNGDSSKVLSTLLQHLPKEKLVFFLDGHYSGGTTAKGILDCPLIEELRDIRNNEINNSLIIIDDFNLFGTSNNEDWSYITEESVYNELKTYKIRTYLRNNKLCILI